MQEGKTARCQPETAMVEKRVALEVEKSDRCGFAEECRESKNQMGKTTEMEKRTMETILLKDHFNIYTS